ncbi:response regulator transcription factor [Siphonobacter aquaeclarae]|jgi:DNA-binding CsgD family transcriptional regulator|uniref:response regulator transcription factor n=1 Tax=Siphonobacter aquaeclarae TaxID=563176 RepID=UPI000B870398|nr:helix-turn-helix transcriptional regulator [Siphonobacter aquaeclarae]MBO9640878.1 helix-turn-helix transcriptional regulator [Siphonobacter aquaeclarae]
MDAHVIQSHLSNREKHILFLLSCELDSRQIAERLGISEYTVFTHRRNIKTKLKLTGKRDGLIRYALLNREHLHQWALLEAKRPDYAESK